MGNYIRSYFKLRRVKHNHSTLKKLTLSLNESMLAQLLDALADNTSIRALRIRYNRAQLTSPLWTTLLGVIDKNQTIQAIDFSASGLHDEHLQTLAAHLKEKQTLNVLNLRDNKITAAGAASVIDLLAGPSNIQQLQLSGNPIGQGFNEIFHAVQKNHQLNTLMIDDKWKSNGIDDSHVDALVAMLKENKTLKQLSLSGNTFSDEGMQTLTQGLLMNHTLEAINLDSAASATLGDSGWSALGKWIAKTRSLHTLSIGCELSKQDTITEAGLTTFLNDVKHNTSVTHLSISFKKDSDTLAIKLADTLKINRTVETVTLKTCPCPLTQPGMEALVNALKMNTTVCQLNEGELVQLKTSRDTVKPATRRELQRLLARNRLIKTIKENPSALPQLLKTSAYELRDAVFFADIIKSLPELLLIEYGQLLVDVMEKPQSRWAELKLKLGISQPVSGIQSVLSCLAHQAQGGDAKSQMALGCIYKNQLLHQSEDLDQAKTCFALATSASDTEISAHAHFEMGQLDFFHTNDYQRATHHFDNAVHQSRNNSPLLYDASRFRDHSFHKLSRNSGFAITDSETQQKQVHCFRQKQACLSTLSHFFTSLDRALEAPLVKPSSVRTYQTLLQQQELSSAEKDKTLADEAAKKLTEGTTFNMDFSPLTAIHPKICRIK